MSFFHWAWPLVAPFGVVIGLFCPRWPGLLIIALVLVPAEIPQGYLDPAVALVALGPWLLAVLWREHARLARALREREQELVREQDRFAAESVRLERTRIARDLHDIIGHCLSVVVIQAAAGERLVGRSPALAEQALDDIASTAAQAQEEMGHLVQLLSPATTSLTWPLATLIGDLTATAAATGLDVSCQLAGDLDAVSGEVSEVGYRAIQESLTNALRHAPGAPTRISVAAEHGRLDIDIANGAPAVAPERSRGSGHGLVGMRERVERLGGRCAAGPSDDGGWRVQIRLPGVARGSTCRHGPFRSASLDPSFRAPPQAPRKVG